MVDPLLLPLPLAPEDEGFFSWLSRPRRMVTNLAAGNPVAAGKQGLDFLLNIPDAALPGDWIPEFSGPETDIEASDVVGGMEPGVTKTMVDILGGAAMDPLTYLPLGAAIGAVAKPVGKAITSTKQGQYARNLMADTMNWHSLDPQQRAMETLAKSRGAMARESSAVEARRIIESLEMPEREAVFDAIQNVAIDPATGQARTLTNRVSGVMQPLADNQLEAIDSLMAHPAYQTASPQRQAAMQQAARDAVSLGQTQADEFLPGIQGKSAGPYLHRTYDFEDIPSPILKPGTGQAQATRARSIKSDVDLAAELNANPDLAKAYNRDLGGSLMSRAEQQGKIAMRKTLGDQLYGTGFDITSDAHRAKVVEKLDQMIASNGPDRDFAVRAKGMFKGIGELDPFSDALAKFNSSWFKPAATVGVIVPRVSFTVRNSLSSIAQALSTPGGRGAVVRDPAFIYQRVVGGIMDPIDEGFKLAGGKRILNDSTNDLLARVEEAYAQAGGSVHKAQSYLANSTQPMAKEALEALQQNVLENPIKVDEVLAELRPDAPMWQKLKSGVWDIPAKLNKHVEDRIRAGLFIAAKRSGQSPVAAAATTRNSVLDYSVPTIENRRMRTYIPFGAFMSQTLPQSAKLLTENLAEGGIPGAIGGGIARNAAAQMFETDPENPIYPDMVGKMAIPWGEDEKRNPQYLTSLGLPLEGLGDLPLGSGGREFERFLGVAAHPLVKGAYSYVSGTEPYFGTPFGGYDKPPAALAAMGMEQGENAALTRQVIGSGAVQPLSHFLNLAEPWMDDRQGFTDDLIRSTTGARIRSVDEDMALRMTLEEAMRREPGIKRYTTYAGDETDPEDKLLMDSLRQAKARIKAKREQAAIE